MTKLIHTHEAAVKTLSVEVKALVIGKKQVTLSVYRQLPKRQLIVGEDCHLAGTPWGRVNYRPGDCWGSTQNHLHIVWQDGAELCRACADPGGWNESDPINAVGKGLSALSSSLYRYSLARQTLDDEAVPETFVAYTKSPGKGVRIKTGLWSFDSHGYGSSMCSLGLCVTCDAERFWHSLLHTDYYGTVKTAEEARPRT